MSNPPPPAGLPPNPPQGVGARLAHRIGGAVRSAMPGIPRLRRPAAPASRAPAAARGHRGLRRRRGARPRHPRGLGPEAERALRNLGAVLDAAGLTPADIAKTTVFLVDMAEFGALNELYARFVSDPPPARSTIAVAALPKGARVEVEAIAVRPEVVDALASPR